MGKRERGGKERENGLAERERDIGEHIAERKRTFEGEEKSYGRDRGETKTTR